MSSKDEPEAPRLLRKLNLMDTTFLAIGSMVGSGIFLTSGKIAAKVASPGLLLLVWVVGGFIALCGALTYAELGVMYPRAGGQYLYLREAYGDFAAFFYGWGFFWFIQCGGIAALAVAFAEYVGYFAPALSPESFLLKVNIAGLHYGLSAGQLVAIASIIILSVINFFGVRSGATVQNILTFLRIGSVGIFVVLGLTAGSRAGITSLPQLFSSPGDSGGSIAISFGLALIAALWTYDGWYAINCAAEEVIEPARNIPRALILATLGVALAYMLVNVIYVIALPFDQVMGATKIGEQASLQLFGKGVHRVSVGVTGR